MGESARAGAHDNILKFSRLNCSLIDAIRILASVLIYCVVVYARAMSNLPYGLYIRAGRVDAIVLTAEPNSIAVTDVDGEAIGNVSIHLHREIFHGEDEY